MIQPDERDRKIAALRDRLSKLTEASLRINESLDVEAARHGAMEGGRAVTRAPYSLNTTLDASGQVEDYLILGMNSDDAERLWQAPEGPKFFEYLNALSGSLRRGELEDFTRSIGLLEFRSPVTFTAFMGAPILHRRARVGNIYVGSDEPGREFTQEDEETLVMFASQAAQVIANARRHRDEQRPRADLETLIDTSPVGVAVFDMRTGAAVSFNQKGRRIVDGLRSQGQTPEDLLGLRTIQRADGREVSLEEFPLAQVLSTTETVRAEEIVMEVPDGRSITVLLNATPIRSEEGDVESVVVTMQDMTPLEEMERLRAEFLGMVSHELLMPLTSILGSAVAMMDATADLDPAEMRQFLRIIVDQAGSMRELIGDLLDVARIETGTLPVSPEAADVAALVDRARNTFLNGGGRHNLDIDLAPDLPLVMVDRRRIVQVIGNLLSNAARHSPESSVIRVVAVRDGIHVEISVVDEGRGIPTERLPHLFRKFSRADDDLGGDTGLGLAICKGIVEAHGGRIWAESEGPGLGAWFAFTVPAVEAASAERARPALSVRQEATGGQPILVVDDDPQTLRYVWRTLSDAGYDPIVTADPEEVLPLMEERRVDLVLLDLMLPGSDGIELMRDILGVADVPVIFLSAYGREQVVARAFESGAADYIVKPFSSTELVARVKAALRRGAGSHHFVPSEPCVLGDLTIDYAERLVTLAGRPVQLRAKEYQLLYELSVNAGRVLTHDELLRRMWGPKKPGDLRALRTHLRRRRQKLGEDASNPTYFSAEPRVGYRMAKGEGSSEGLTNRQQDSAAFPLPPLPPPAARDLSPIRLNHSRRIWYQAVWNHRLPNHISKMVLSIVKIGPPGLPHGRLTRWGTDERLQAPESPGAAVSPNLNRASMKSHDKRGGEIQMTNLYYDVFETRLGWIGLLASSKGLRRTTLPQANPDECVALLGEEVEKATPSPERFEGLRSRLEQYFQGEPATFDQEPLDMDDAPSFFRAAWDACRSIPVGETRSYKWLAAQAGRPNAPRAAGQSMARNRLPIIVPCHRVLASDGGLGGFGRDASQLGLKRQLLDIEGSVV